MNLTAYLVAKHLYLGLGAAESGDTLIQLLPRLEDLCVFAGVVSVLQILLLPHLHHFI